MVLLQYLWKTSDQCSRYAYRKSG